MGTQGRRRVRKRLVWFSPVLLAVALTPAFLQTQYTCNRSGDTRLLSLELEVQGVDRLAFDPAIRVYDLWLPADATTATVRAVPMDPAARVTWYVPDGAGMLASGSLGVGGGEETIDLPPDGYSLYIGVFPPGGATNTYIAAINPECPMGYVCDDGNECTTDQCNPPNYMSCQHSALPDDTFCGVDGVCEAGACRERSWETPVLLETDDFGDASAPQVAMDAQGDAVAIWMQRFPWSTYNSDIRSNRFSSGAWGVAETMGWGWYPPQLAMNPSGDAVVIWQAYGGRVSRTIGSNRLTSGVWDDYQTIGCSSGGICANQQVAIDAQGNALAVWVDAIPPPSNTRIVSASSTPAGDWANSGGVPGNAEVVWGLHITMDPQGDAVLVSQTTGGVWAHRLTSGVWGSSELLAADAAAPQLAMDAQGDAVVVWQQSDGVVDNIWANRLTSGVWGGTEFAAVDAAAPQLAMDAQGDAVVVWQQSDGVVDNIWANRLTSGVWGSSELLSSGGAPRVAMNAQGDAVVIWQSGGGVWANRLTSGVWGSAELVAGSGSAPQVAIDAQGDALVVWQQSDGVRDNIWANRLTSGVWGAAQVIELDDTGDATAPQVGIDAQGDAIAVWQQWDGVRTNIWANRYE